MEENEQNSTEKINSNIRINKNKEKNSKTIIDNNKFMVKLLRRFNTTIYFNNDCFLILNGLEMRTIPVLLLYLYDNKYYNNNGIMFSELKKNCKIAYTTVRFHCLLLAPVLINIRSARKDMHSRQARYISLTELGVKAVLKIKEKIAEVKQDEH